MLAAFEYDRSNGISVPSVTITSVLACNYQCYGCTVGSNLGIKDNYGVTDRIAWIENLSTLFSKHNLHLESMSIMGGEPLLNDAFLYLIESVKKQFPKSEIILYTNGVLLPKRTSYLEKLSSFGRDLIVRVTIHQNNKEYHKLLTKSLYLLRNNNIRFDLVGEHFPVLHENPPDFWHYRRNLDKNGKINPANEKNYIKSWAICPEKYCTQLYDNALWKCPSIAYLRHQLKATNQLEDNDWQKYLKYKPLDITTCSFEELVNFYTTGPEDICSMCPSVTRMDRSKPIFKKDYSKIDVNSLPKIVTVDT